ncbi:MAG: hypothetical protein ABH873_06375 [Candidatus Firestonebacteria bacterium]
MLEEKNKIINLPQSRRERKEIHNITKNIKKTWRALRAWRENLKVSVYIISDMKRKNLCVLCDSV